MTDQLPLWDLSQYFPGFDSPEFRSAVDKIKADIAAQVSLVEAVSEQEPVAAVEQYLTNEIDIINQLMPLMSYASGHMAVNTRDAAAIKATSELQMAMIPLQQAGTRFAAWVGGQDVEAIIAASAIAADHAFMLRNEKINAQHQMSQVEEDLATELTLSGGSAFGDLQSSVSSQILVTFEKTPGEMVTLPISEVRNLANDPDREIRKRAYDAEVAAWKQWETPIAAALNGVKGEHGTLAEKRGWDSVLASALHQNHIDQETLDAMMAAARDAFPDVRRYWTAKAKVLGLEKLEWCDITAPVGENNREWQWDEGMDFIKEQFGTFSQKMADMVQRSQDENWIDAGPREGKVGGAFCMPTVPGKSGVLSNFTPSFDGVSTMAHELGHAYHNLCQEDASPIWSVSTPMTLAETASTFCETILRKAAIRAGSDDEKFAILEGGLVDAGQIVVDITSRFLFEQSVFERRKNGLLTAEEFCELMIAAQKETYGDAIVEESLHPYMWAVKSHYYSPGYAYYNYPYMFGLLFGLGLYAMYLDDPETFKANYDDLLASTGSADAATLAARFGIDTRSKAFWAASLDVIRQDIDEFCALVDARTA
ncbi:MAG: M3 family oligoendopeptidase [Thermomicrobiales bacterium]|nr:M3 family oligoendopeptidase [Thermomicrobiales bacterium]MCO5227379.1 M3 family oligoendopeptidase [Thermomicrobiales bacterium]